MDGKFEAPNHAVHSEHKDIWSAVAAEAYTAKNQPAKVQEAACYGTFHGPAPDEAFRLNPPQIGINGGLAVFNQNCDDDRIKALKNFKPDRA